jgi:predicted PurR-regulated permease PerM
MAPHLPPIPESEPSPSPAGHVPQGDYWDGTVRDRWFFAALTLSTIAMLVLFSPYLYVLLIAAVVVVVTWPIYVRLVDRLRGHRAIAAALILVLLVAVVLTPIGLLVWVFIGQSAVFVEGASQWLAGGGLDTTLAELQARLDGLGQRFGFEFDFVEMLRAPVQDAAVGALQQVGTNLPALITTAAGLSISLIIFMFTAGSLYLEGPRALQAIKNLVPLDDRYEDRLFVVFQNLANNMVVASLATSTLQGLVASVGYALAGLDQVVFFSVCTGVASFVPVVGTAFVWVPVGAYVLFEHGWGWALFIALWSGLLTASVDNLIKPFFLRGDNHIHPLLIFLGVFGGLSWMGVPGVLVGPMIVVFFVALYTIYVDDFLHTPGLPPLETGAPGGKEEG